MNTMRSRKVHSSFESHSPEKAALLHRCPVCGTVHEVSVARAQFAYGRQLACSPDCEAERRHRVRASFRRAPTLVSNNVFPESFARRPLPAGSKDAPFQLVNSVRKPSFPSLKTSDEAGPEGICTVAGRSADVPDFHDYRARYPAHTGEHKAVISATVESTDVLCVRRAIFQAGGESVGILKTAPVPHSSKIRVFIGMKLGVLDSIMTAIMRSVTACEFGRVVRM